VRAHAATLCLVALLCGCGDSEPDARQARELTQRARQALARGEREEALAAIESLEHSRPESPDALSERARLLIQAGEAARVVWLLEDGVKRFPDDAALRLLLAEAALLVNDPARAERTLATLPESMEPEQAAQVLLLRARAALARGDLDTAIARFREAESRDPHSAALRAPRIGALLAERRLAEAALAVREARSQARSESDREMTRGFELALHQLRAADARERLQAALLAGDASAAEAARRDLADAVDDTGALARSARRDAAAWQSYVLGLIGSGRADEARSALDAARRDDPEWLALHALRAWALLAMADDAGAEEALREGMALDPSPASCLPLVRFLSTRERRDEALATLDAALSRASDGSPDAAALLHARAELLLDAGAAEQAEAAIAAFAAARPGADEPATELLRARLLLLRGDADAAARRLHALAPRLDSAATQYWLARALELSGDRAGAERRYALSTLRAPAEPGAFAALARLARQRGAWREAAAAGQQLVLRAPGAIEGWETWVEALLQLGETQAAREVAQRSQQLLPDAPEPLLLRARALRAAGRSDEALARVAQARERFGDGPEIASERVLALAALGRSDEALSAAEGALASSDPTPEQRAALEHARALALFESGRFDEGARAVDAALVASDADLRPLRTRCRVAASSGRFASAREDCARYLAARPDDAGIHFVLGVVLDQSGDAAAARRAYRRAAELDPAAAAPRNNLAQLRFEAGDLEGALEAAQQAYALAPDDAQVLDTLGGLYLAKGLPERAVALLERAHALAPDDAAIAQRLADARGAASDRQPRSDMAGEALPRVRWKGDTPAK
jgi:tetratricopeptide (TPR) repeat protein